MLRKILFKASLPLIATPFIFLVASPASSASVYSQQKLISGLGSASNSRNSELISGWYDQDRDYDRHNRNWDYNRHDRNWNYDRHDRNWNYDRHDRNWNYDRHDRNWNYDRRDRNWNYDRHHHRGLTIIVPW